MSAKQTAHDHIIPVKLYLGVGATLIALTGVTVAISFVPLGPFNLVVALSIATFKAILVVLIFMHLLYDNKFYMLIFVSALLFLGFFIVLTMFDTMKRDYIYEQTAGPIRTQAAMYDSLLTAPVDSAAVAADSTGAPAQEHK